MKIFFTITMIFTIGIVNSFAQAQPCDDSSLDEISKEECLQKYLISLDKELEKELDNYIKTIKEFYSYMSKEDFNGFINKIIESQENWKKFRETESEVVAYEASGGQGASAFISLCKIKLTEERIKRFKDSNYYLKIK